MSVESKPPPASVAPGESTGPTSVEARQWTYKEVAAAKRVGVQTVMEWVKRGMIPSPVYTGFTARFTADQVSVILSGTSLPGTYEVTPSPRSAIGRMGGGSKFKKPGKARNAAQQKKDARPKPALKPISPRRRPTATATAKHTKKGGKK
jgi:hypothetical protein